MDKYFLLILLIAILAALYMYQDKIFPKKCSNNKQKSHNKKFRKHEINKRDPLSEERTPDDESDNITMNTRLEDDEQSINSSLSLGSISMRSNNSMQSNLSDGSVSFGSVSYKSMESGMSGGSGISQFSGIDGSNADSEFDEF